MMDRRTFIGAVMAVVGTAPRAALAPPTKSRPLGFLRHRGSTQLSSSQEAFRRSLRELGWIEGQNVTIEYRWAEGNPDRLPTLVADRESARPDDPAVVAAAGGRGHPVTAMQAAPSG